MSACASARTGTAVGPHATGRKKGNTPHRRPGARVRLPVLGGGMGGSASQRGTRGEARGTTHVCRRGVVRGPAKVCPRTALPSCTPLMAAMVTPQPGTSSGSRQQGRRHDFGADTHTHSVVAAHAPGGLCELVEIDFAVKAHRHRGDWLAATSSVSPAQLRKPVSRSQSPPCRDRNHRRVSR